jgi:uncharacterized SAM-binding protein YcdF (DUF218 family)
VTAREWLALMRRRWLVLAAVFVVTLAAVVLVHKRPIVYEDCASVAATAPPTKLSPNAYTNTQQSLVSATGVVTTELSSEQVQQRLQAEGLTASYTAQVHNTGPSETPAYLEPLADLCTSSYNSALSLRTVQALVVQFGVILRDRQMALHVPKASLATETVIAPASSQPITGRPSQAYVGVLVIGVILAIALAAWTDQFMRRREQRAGSGPPGPSSGSRERRKVRRRLTTALRHR